MSTFLTHIWLSLLLVFYSFSLQLSYLTYAAVSNGPCKRDKFLPLILLAFDLLVILVLVISFHPMLQRLIVSYNLWY